MREEGGEGEGGVRREENMEYSFLGLEAEELILGGDFVEVKAERR